MGGFVPLFCLSLLRLGDLENLILPQPLSNNLFAARGPVDFNAIDFVRITQAEVKRQNALRQVA